MFDKIKKSGPIVAVIIILGAGFLMTLQTSPVFADTLDQRGGPAGRGGAGAVLTPGSGLLQGPLSDAEKEALSQAILEEYGALNLYQSVINQLGNVYPFSQIVVSEQQHVKALLRQADKYGVVIPDKPGLNTATQFSSLAEACQAGVTAEKADAALYDRLSPSVNHSDILQVFNNLQNASLNSHLPAFETCQ
ncbi:MAG: DUF2202 domain-containing protein [Anaerolineae bacterium]|nr:DUF2202 domain-containing protein [Anaerolineae bacterium]